ncbi:cyclic AMP-dependent transcription factor ATF-6 alpha isoform X2 [Procambarus clarkii]|uniref:cyclic AMP-dependent transcription factor ATF-6 alpha isoform X2 n=1 Tax=Procambarus clarkii TaxID=6728 RepID=UPI001E678313|nr:cyclic AMP-dependent transcription factor ATF-6 alpha-like isoform X2 [Procambarus clarkii]
MCSSVILNMFMEEEEDKVSPEASPQTHESVMEISDSYLNTPESFLETGRSRVEGCYPLVEWQCTPSLTTSPATTYPATTPALPLFSHLLSESNVVNCNSTTTTTTTNMICPEVKDSLEDFLLQMDFAGLTKDVSESSSDDDLIHKLSNDLELPLALDDMEPVSSWSPEPGDIFQSLTSNENISNVLKSEGDMTAEELTRALYPNLVSGSVVETRSHPLTRIRNKVKEEPCSPQHFLQMPSSPDDNDDIWELLCDSDVKPIIRALDTPPFTPPQAEGSPPQSPQPPSPVSLPSSAVLLSPAPHHHQQRHAANGTTINHISQPIKVVTITTRNGTTGPGSTKGGRITKTMKIQPKMVTTTSTQPQVISIVNSSSGPKLTLPKTVTRTIPTGGTRIVQVKPPSGPTQVTTNTTITNPLSSILTTQIGSQATVVSPPPPPLPPPAAAPLAPLAPALAPGMKHGTMPDLKAFKRQQRMIKNRESASLSRKKKKEYLTALEGNIADLQKENQKLKEENSHLQQRIISLEAVCASLRQSVSRSPSRKTTTALFALIFLFSLNLGPLTGVLLSSESKLSSLKTMMHGSKTSSITSGFHQRSLLWSSDDLVSTETGSTPQLATNTSHTCPIYFNATESLRLETELRGWFEHKFRPSKSEKKREDKLRTSHPKTKEGRSLRAIHGDVIPETRKPVVNEVWNALVPPSQPPTRLYRYIHPDVLQVDPSTSTEEETAVMTTIPRLSSFLEAIQRRDDTYYVVSFSPDHLLVPATARNDSARPRMSLLMPTPRPINESLAPPDAHIAMMQIDCEVIHTRLVHVSEEVVPAHLRAGGTNASHPSSDSASNNRQERRNTHGRSRPFLSKPIYPTK